MTLADEDVDGITEEQLRELIDAHGAALTLYARTWCNFPDDALQEALIDLLRQDPSPEQPAAWLFTTIRRRAMNLTRGERCRSEHQQRAAEQRDSWFVDDLDADLEGAELVQMLERLPSLEREIVVARAWGQLPFEQIAELVEVSRSAVHRRYRRALELLAEMMEDTHDQADALPSPLSKPHGDPSMNRTER